MCKATTVAASIVALFSALLVPVAGALEITTRIDAVYNASMTGASETAVVSGTLVSNASVGDIVQISIEVGNIPADRLISIFASALINPAVLALHDGSFAPQILIGGTPSNPTSLSGVGAPSIHPTAPTDEWIRSLAYSSTGGTDGTGPSIDAAIIFFEVLEFGSSPISVGFRWPSDLIETDTDLLTGFSARRFATLSGSNLLVVAYPPGPDTDGDLIPDDFDNCFLDPNGPNDALNQTDEDGDGFGTACDCDYDNSGFTHGNDLLELWSLFGGPDTDPPIHDNTGDGLPLGDDVLRCFQQFNKSPPF